MDEQRKRKTRKGVVLETMTMQEYLERCKTDPKMYASVAERMLSAIGEPTIVDTKEDPRLSRIFVNRHIKVYPAFADFYGMEDVVEQIVSFFRHAEQGLEETKQILYLLGPVGSGKSSLAEKLKALVEIEPFYALAVQNGNGRGDKYIVSPIYESPLGLFNKEDDGEWLGNEYNIPQRRLIGVLSPWAEKRLDEFEGDPMKFHVVKMYPSRTRKGGVGVSKTEPGDENSQDVTTLIGKCDIRMLEEFSENDPDGYLYSGGLNRTTQGMLEFVEMFKASLNLLNPFLTATQEHNYAGSGNVGAMPYEGVILAHSNETEWLSFKNNRANEALLSRIYIIKVPYCLRVEEEISIYEKMLKNSKLFDVPCAPWTLKLLAQFSVLSRIKEPENSSFESKMRVYNGESLKDVDPKAKSIQEYRDHAGVDEGLEGIDPRVCFKILAKVFNYSHEEVAANPIHLFYILEQHISQEQLGDTLAERYMSFLKGVLVTRYIEYLEKEIQEAYLESYSEYGQNIFDRYITYADFWIQDKEYRDEDTGVMFDRDALNNELEKIEKPAGIGNPKDFRNEIVNFVLRARASNEGKNPDWTSYEKLREVIEKKMFSSTEDILPVISFNAKASAEDDKKHKDFVSRMKRKGYTERTVRLVCEWYLRVRKSS
jgi:serine protein kinase